VHVIAVCQACAVTLAATAYLADRIPSTAQLAHVDWRAIDYAARPHGG